MFINKIENPILLVTDGVGFYFALIDNNRKNGTDNQDKHQV